MCFPSWVDNCLEFGGRELWFNKNQDISTMKEKKHCPFWRDNNYFFKIKIKKSRKLPILEIMKIYLYKNKNLNDDEVNDLSLFLLANGQSKSREMNKQVNMWFSVIWGSGWNAVIKNY